MPRKESPYDNLTVTKELKKKITERKDSDPKTKYMNESQFASYLFDQLFAHEERLKQHGAFLEFKGVVDDQIYIRDNFKGRSFPIRINSEHKELRCEEDASNSCIHVGFAFAIKEVYDKLIDQGFRPPKHIR